MFAMGPALFNAAGNTPGYGAYAKMILADDPVLFLPLDEATNSGIATDLSGYGNNGSYLGPNTSSPSLFPSGRSSMRMAGSTIAIPSTANLALAGDFTLEMTIRSGDPTFSYGTFPKMIFKPSNYHNGIGNYLLSFARSTGNVTGRVSTADVNYNDTAYATNCLDGVARTYTLRRTGDVLDLLVEGIKQSSISVAEPNVTTTDAITVGGGDEQSAIDAYFQWVSLFDFSVSDARIAQRIALR